MRDGDLKLSSDTVSPEADNSVMPMEATNNTRIGFVERCGIATVAVYDQLASIYTDRKVEHNPSHNQHKIIGCGSIAVTVSGVAATANFYM